jgi:asparagine synthase (glutamine-hydrolysing)
MCGIAGIIQKKEHCERIPQLLQTMTDSIQHRGPNSEGIYAYKNVGLGHRRLSIIDLSHDGHQPMFYQNKNLVITYNGEIYNYIELKQELEKLGHVFFSKTDTEVILAAYHEWGTNCVKKFNGMWAFAILDKVNEILFCSRDRFGVKPFYFINHPNLFAFGSEIRQLLPLGHQTAANKTLVVDFLLTSIRDHQQETFFKDIHKLPAGHHLIYSLKENTFKINKYYELSRNDYDHNLNTEESIESFINLLEDAVKLRLRADVPVGTCLSGGLDSSTIASIAAPLYQQKSGSFFKGITAISEQENNNEAQYAQEVIQHANMDWLQVKPSYSDFVNSLSKVVLAQEEPFGSTSLVMQYFVMQTAKNNGITILLDGQGGDEILLGYGKYYGSYLLTMLKEQGFSRFIHGIRNAGANNKQLSLTNAIKFMAGSMLPELRFKYYSHQQNYLRSTINTPEHLSQYSKSSYDVFKLQKLEIERTNLPVLLCYEDKNSMAHSIETRLPFLDYRVVEAALNLPGKYKIHQGWSKWILRKGMENKMPKSIAWRKNKFGFEAPEILWQQQHASIMLSAVKNSQIIQEIAHSKKLATQYKNLDRRSQWRLYSIALWEDAFGVSS